MVGQGRPKTSYACRTDWVRLGRTSGMALVLASLLVCAGRAEESVRVRIAWGGNTARIWQGTISVNEGELSQLRPLGIEADEPGSMWIEAYWQWAQPR